MIFRELPCIQKFNDMVYKKLYFNLIIRILLIIATSIWFAFEVIEPIKIYTIVVISLLLIIQGYLLIHLLNSFNREVYNYFNSLRDEGSSSQFRTKEENNNELTRLINDISNMIRDARIKKEEQYQYLKFIIETIPVGIIITRKNGSIILSNNIVSQLFKVESVKRIKTISDFNPALEIITKNIQTGEKALRKIKVGEHYLKLLISLSDFKINDELIHLYTIQDVKSELDENEIIAWQKLIRVLNHELMNSITPITTLTHAIKKCITENDSIKQINQIDTEILKDILKNANLIEERSQGLIHFIGNYKRLTSIKNIEKTEFSLTELFQKLEQLFGTELSQRNITFNILVYPENLSLSADIKLVEQVLINLIKNAIESFESNRNKFISLKAQINSNGKISISVSDNGKGIDESIIDDIFIPFFTTKKEGSGVGLSFSKQVMRMHDGEINAKTEPDKGSVFTLLF